MGDESMWMKSIAVIFFLFVCWISHQADVGGQNIFFDVLHMIPFGDKVGHVLLFGGLTLAVNLALKGARFVWFGHRLYWGSCLVLVFAFLEEITQVYVQNRSLDWLDGVCDLIGVWVFSLITQKVLGHERFTKPIEQ